MSPSRQDKTVYSMGLSAPPHGEPKEARRLVQYLCMIPYCFFAVLLAIPACLFPAYNVCQALFHVFQRRFLHTRPVFLTTDGKVFYTDPSEGFSGMIVTTHKSWADFMVPHWYRHSCVLSRMVLAFVFPLVTIVNYSAHFILFFHKGKCTKDSLERAIVRRLSSGRNKLIVFPEGSRAHVRGMLRMRSGVLRIAYENGISVLVAPQEGAQYVFNEKTGVLPERHVYRDIYVCVNGTFDPKDYYIDGKPESQGFDSFFSDVRSAFIEGYKFACSYYDEHCNDRLPVLLGAIQGPRDTCASPPAF